jgi:predicted amidohydrolase
MTTSRSPGSPGTLRVAAAQATSVAGDLAANVATACSLVADAAAQGARVVVLPELFLTGYAPEAWRHEDALALDDDRLAPLADLAAGRGVTVVASGAVRRALDATTLSAVVVDPGGEVSAPYDKQHLCGEDEQGFFTAGDHGATLVVDGWELALGICYDGSFPEHARAAADDGDYDPVGRPPARAGHPPPGFVGPDLDPAEVARVQELNPIARDRLDSLGTRLRVQLAG